MYCLEINTSEFGRILLVGLVSEYQHIMQQSVAKDTAPVLQLCHLSAVFMQQVVPVSDDVMVMKVKLICEGKWPLCKKISQTLDIMPFPMLQQLDYRFFFIQLLFHQVINVGLAIAEQRVVVLDEITAQCEMLIRCTCETELHLCHDVTIQYWSDQVFIVQLLSAMDASATNSLHCSLSPAMSHSVILSSWRFPELEYTGSSKVFFIVVDPSRQ